METMNLLVQKYVWKVDSSIKLLLYSPQYKKNQTLKEIMNALFISSDLPQNLCGETILDAKRNNKKLSFQNESNFVCSGHNLFHMRNGKEEFNFKYFKAWGCLSKVQVPIPKRI